MANINLMHRLRFYWVYLVWLEAYPFLKHWILRGGLTALIIALIHAAVIWIESNIHDSVATLLGTFCIFMTVFLYLLLGILYAPRAITKFNHLRRQVKQSDGSLSRLIETGPKALHEEWDR